MKMNNHKGRQFNPLRLAIVIAAIILFGILAESNSDGQELTLASRSATQNPSGAIWATNFDDALDQAQLADVPMMIVFTGSADWCPWCRRLEEEVFQTDSFANWALDRVVLLEVEYPDTASLPAPLARQNRRLIEQYKKHITGYPTVLFLTPQRRVVGKVGFVPGGALKWIQRAQKIVGKRDKQT